MKYWVALLFLGSFLFAETGFSEQEKSPPVFARAVVLVANEKEVLNEFQQQQIEEGVYLVGIGFLRHKEQLEKELEPLYYQKEVTPEVMQSVKAALYDYFRRQGYPFVLVIIPPQKGRGDVLQLIVQHSLLGEVRVEGNRWSSDKRYQNYLSFEPGDLISLKSLAYDVDFMNRNPYRQVDVIYSPGKENLTTDLTLKVKDNKPYRFYLGYNNHGVPITGRGRGFAGFSWDQLFHLDHLFFYQYTTNYHKNRFHAHTFQYLALLPCQTLCNLYGGYSIVHADLKAPCRHNRGSNIQGSLRYTLPMLPSPFAQDLTLGFDIKSTNNTVEFVDYNPIFGQRVNVTQWMVGYQYRHQKNQAKVQGDIECFFSPGRWIARQKNKDFGSLRTYAKNKWVYLSFLWNRKNTFFSIFSYSLLLKGQVSSHPLLPSEQLSIGGHTSVRGYEEREYNADTGMVGNFEIHLPSFLRRKKEAPREAYFLLFVDAGAGFDQTQVAFIPSFDWLWSAGAGFRGCLGSHLSVKVDWGFRLKMQDSSKKRKGKLYFSVSGNY